LITSDLGPGTRRKVATITRASISVKESQLVAVVNYLVEK